MFLRRHFEPQLAKATEDTDRHLAGRGAIDHNVQPHRRGWQNEPKRQQKKG